jgi:uncharacterized SAM-dependent methyltransferase
MSDDTRKNYISDVEKQFGDITGSYTTLVDLGTDYLFRRLLINSSLNQPVTLKFTNNLTAELNVLGNWSFDFDEFWHDNVIEIKHNGVAPTEGFLKIVSWRAE